MIPPSADFFVHAFNTSAAFAARELFESTGKRTSPYESMPERETYTEFEVYQRQDGSRYARKREIARWGGAHSIGEWTGPVEGAWPNPGQKTKSTTQSAASAR